MATKKGQYHPVCKFTRTPEITVPTPRFFHQALFSLRHGKLSFLALIG